MAGIRIEFSQFGHFDYFEIIRSYTSMSGIADAELPSPLVSNLKTMYYIDTSIVDGESYYYIARVFRDGVSLNSSEVKVTATLSDIYWQNVSALLHFEGDNNSASFTDETGRVWDRLGDTKLSAVKSMFGLSSLFLDGASSLSTGFSSGFAYGTGDFTWELFANFNSLSGNRYLIDHSSGLGNNGTLSYYNNTLRYYNPTTGVSGPLYNTLIPLEVNRWYHIAIVRLSGVTTIYIDGIAKASGNDLHNYNSLELWLGRYAGGGGTFFDGYIDELRITKGVARYTENFTPPAEQFLSN